MNAEVLGGIAGAGLSLVFSYVPGVKPWFDNLEPNYKRLVMLASLLIAAGGIFGLACLGRYDAVACDVDGAWQMLEVFALAAIANQTTYQLSPR